MIFPVVEENHYSPAITYNCRRFLGTNHGIFQIEAAVAEPREPNPDAHGVGEMQGSMVVGGEVGQDADEV